MKPGAGFVDIVAGAHGTGSSVAAFARGEAGWKLTPSASLFGFGEAEKGFQSPLAWQAGVGFRATW